MAPSTKGLAQFATRPQLPYALPLRSTSAACQPLRSLASQATAAKQPAASKQAGAIKYFPNQGARMIDPSRKVEEENWDWFSTDVFYPVNIGELFPPRYQVLGKLGFGTRSTVWLCRDLRNDAYVTLKVCERNSIAAKRELAAFAQLNVSRSRHPGGQMVRQLLDTFKIPRWSGEHTVLVHEPLGLSVEMLRNTLPDRRIPKQLLQNIVKTTLIALDFLHTEAKMIHTDLQAGNVHLRIKDASILRAFEERELRDPSPRKAVGNDFIFESRDLVWDNNPGHPILCDFGEARYGKTTYTDPIQPSAYRSPEVIFGIPWTTSVDIWNLGVMTWHLSQNRLLFPATDPQGLYSEPIQLASIAARIGAPPLEFLFRAPVQHRSKYNAAISDAAALSTEKSLEDSEQFGDAEERRMFCAFIAKMVKWVPERRATANELLKDEWLNS